MQFTDLNLPKPILEALIKSGYQEPSPIQAQTIPFLLEGKDVVGMAQTGTGKTAAFSLPLLAKMEPSKTPQALILTPTRELCIQVADAIKRYAANMPGINVMPIYGGQSYTIQIQALKRGANIIVGTPGRVMDHIKKGTLKLSDIHYFVLDEADEMLNMGFLEDVEWILEHTPEERQMVLFSATMPKTIQSIIKRHLRNPEKVTIAAKTATATTIRQRYLMTRNDAKLDLLTRILEAEPTDAAIIFVRTKQATALLADKLKESGLRAIALNGDVEQKQRERTIGLLKNKQVDILVATDVAARGLDVERISHVINYDIPFNPESYIHRIGRTGRAGRQGEAILLLTKQEFRHLKMIERVTNQRVEQMEIPSAKQINEKRAAQFKESLKGNLLSKRKNDYAKVIEEFIEESQASPVEVAAAIANMLNNGKPLFVTDEIRKVRLDTSFDEGRPIRKERLGGRRSERREFDRRGGERRERDSRRSGAKRGSMCAYQVSVGRMHGVRPGQIVGAIANEASISSDFIGDIKIHQEYTTVDLPKDLPAQVIKHLQKVWVAGQQLKLSRMS